MTSWSGAPAAHASFEVELSASDEWSHHKKRLFFIAAALASWAAVLVPTYALARLF